MRGRGLTRRCGMGICYRATRHWRSHQKIVSCLERFPLDTSPRLAQIPRLSSRSGGPIIPFFYRKFWFAATVVKTSSLNIRSSVISLEEGRKKRARSVLWREMEKNLARKGFISRLFFFFFFFFSLILLRARSVSERCLFDNFFSFFYEFYSCVSLSFLAPWYRREFRKSLLFS